MAAPNVTPFPQPDQPEPGKPRSYAAWWRCSFDEAEDARLVCATDGVVLEVNYRAQKLLGLHQRASLCACPLFDSETVENFRQLLARPDGPLETLYSVNVSSDGVRFVADVQVTPLDPGCSLVVFKDAGRRWRTEAHAQRMLAAIEATPDAVWLADAELRVLFVNPAFEKATGYASGEASGRTIDFLRAPGQEHTVRDYSERIRTSSGWVGEMINRRRDGSTYPVEVTISPIHDQEKRLLGCAAFERDVTAKQQLQNELLLEHNLVHSIIDSLDACIYTVDGSLRITHFNNAWRRMPAHHGWLSLKGSPETGRCLLDYVPDSARRVELEKLCREVLEEGRTQEICTMGEDGNYWTIQIVPWRHEGQIRGLIYKVTDNAALVSLRGQLSHAQKMPTLTAVTAGVIHDFNNLLLTIRGNAGLVMLDGQLAPAARGRLEQVDQAAAQAGSLAQQLLAYSRDSEEKAKTLDFDHIIHEASEMAKRTLRGRAVITLKPAGEPLQVLMAPTRALQLLLTLCLRAVNSMAERAEITIANERVMLTDAQLAKVGRGRTAGFLCCRVTDNGNSIPSEALPRLFNPLFVPKSKGKNAGVNLAVIQEIATGAGGFAEVDSNPDQGTVFRIYLPLDGGSVVPTVLSAPSGVRQGSGRLLVVDDLDPVLEFARTFLEQAGYEVLTASNADQALALLEKQITPVDLVLTDYVMPGKNGWQLIQEITLRWPGIKSIIVSGYLSDDERAQIRQQANVPFLAKPYSISEATKLIAEVLAN